MSSTFQRTDGNRLVDGGRKIGRMGGVLAAVVCLVTIADPARATSYWLSENGDYLVVVAAPIEEYGQLYSDIHDVYRVAWFNAEYFEPTNGVGGHGPAAPDTYVSAIFEINYNDVVVSHFYDMSIAALEEHVTLLQGHAEMIQVDAYQYGDTTRYAYIAYHQNGPDWEVLAGMPSDIYGLLESQLPPSMNVVNRSYTNLLSPTPLTTSLFKADNTDTVAYGGLNWSQLSDARNDLTQQGYRMTSMEIHNYPGLVPSYAPVFKRNGNYIFSTQSVWTGFGSDIVAHNEGSAAGSQPLFVALTDLTYVGGAYGAMPTFYAAWLGQAKVKRDLDFFRGDPTLTYEMPHWGSIDTRSGTQALKSR